MSQRRFHPSGWQLDAESQILPGIAIFQTVTQTETMSLDFRTISLVVIMLELTGGSPSNTLWLQVGAGLDYIVPFMISVLMAKAVGDSLNEGPSSLFSSISS